MRPIMPAECARACQQLSLRLDSELSEFETVLLEAHLARCAECQAFGQSITGVTLSLRAVPAETPAVSFQPPRRVTRLDALLAGSLRAGSAVAAAAAVVAVGVFALSGLVAFPGSTSGVASVDLHNARVVMDLQERRLQQLDSASLRSSAQVPRGLASAESGAMGGTTSISSTKTRSQERR